jgi:hypothetical protein
VPTSISSAVAGERLLSLVSKPSCPCIFSFYLSVIFLFVPMEQPTISDMTAPKAMFAAPPKSAKPITALSYELRPAFIAMVREQSFLGLEYDNPYHHLREFEQLGACLTIAGMSQETLRWKLFPFSLSERAKQWYAQNVGKVAGDWEDLQKRFCLAFYPLSQIAALR